MRKEDYKASRQILERLSQNHNDSTLQQRAQALLSEVVSLDEGAARYQALRESPLRSNAGATKAPASNVASAGSTPSAEPDEKPDPSKYLREALRTPTGAEKQVQGLLVRVDCDAKGVTFVVQVAGGVLKLWSKSFEETEIVSFSTDAGTEISCGARKPQNVVVVCYVPGDSRQKVDGLAKSVEFVPAEFKLHPDR